MPDKEQFENKLRALVSGDADINKERIRGKIEEVFRDEVERQKLTILAIARGKISLIEKFMKAAHLMADSLGETADAEFKAEFEDESLADRIKMMDNLVRSILSLTASSAIVSQLKDALMAVERTLVQDQHSLSTEMGRLKTMMSLVRSIDEQTRAEDAKFSDN